MGGERVKGDARASGGANGGGHALCLRGEDSGRMAQEVPSEGLYSDRGNLRCLSH